MPLTLVVLLLGDFIWMHYKYKQSYLHLPCVCFPAAINFSEAPSPDDPVDTEVIHGQLGMEEVEMNICLC